MRDKTVSKFGKGRELQILSFKTAMPNLVKFVCNVLMPAAATEVVGKWTAHTSEISTNDYMKIF